MEEDLLRRRRQVKKFRKKPIVIEAVQWDGFNNSEIEEFVGQELLCIVSENVDLEIVPHSLIIPTLEGRHSASRMDWVIKDILGEFYTCKPDIFEKTYEEVSSEEV